MRALQQRGGVAPARPQPHAQQLLRRRSSARAAIIAAAAAATSTAEAPAAAAPAPAAAAELQRDPSAAEALMQAATEFALRRRLKEHASVAVAVRCAPGNGLLEGRFDAMAIQGEAWRTPLGMTARRLAVDIGPLQVDYGALVATRKVALAGARPRGAVTITLTAADLGAFMTHPLFGRAAATAVDGRAFAFDPNSVAIRPPSGDGDDGGRVTFEGVWAGDGRRYRVIMLPGGGSAGGGSGGGSGKKLRVGAQLVADDAANGGGGGNGSDNGGSAPAVAAGVARFFTHLAIDLDGIELSKPALLLRPWGGGNGSNGGVDGGGGGSNGGSNGGVLDIRMAVRIRAFPPLDMQF